MQLCQAPLFYKVVKCFYIYKQKLKIKSDFPPDFNTVLGVKKKVTKTSKLIFYTNDFGNSPPH